RVDRRPRPRNLVVDATDFARPARVGRLASSDSTEGNARSSRMTAQTAVQVPLSRVLIDDEIRSRVAVAVDSGQYILGPECKAFEKELASYFERKHCVLVSNATSGLTLALMAHGIGAGHEVLVPAHTAFPTI